MVGGLSVFRVCSILMAFLFAMSASFQLNDPDWYLWIPLYSTATIVNSVNGASNLMAVRKLAKCTFWLGIIVFIKLGILDLQNGIVGLWSMDMRERAVREKLGSGLVIISMCLHLRKSTPKNLDYGMLTLVVVSYGLCSAFFVLHRKEMKF
ncbi:transmembrane protein 220 [Ipomoea triloba]|uniref:transmembrane protein 220 n=1 Tax=Ipomoea triloba TaxID=35885 RepID=UPI00125D060D|nr:transmembrane protein 220 [Ipomoea triloba]